MALHAFKVFLGLCFWLAVVFAEPAENKTEAVDEAEYRQGGVGQQLMSNYPMMGLYGASNGYMQNAGGAGSGYVNMLRNLYRPPSFGLTDKVRHWVKSFMNRRQYVKPYYTPSMSGMTYNAEDFGAKPMFAGANSYKAISVPLRQLQKYYKPYYGSAEGGSAQFMQSPPRGAPASAAANSYASYSPSGAASSGMFASETANAGHFSQGGGGLYGSASDMYGAIGSAGSPASGLFSSGGSPASGLFSSGGSPASGLFSSGGSPGGSSNIFSTGGGSNSGIFSSGDISSSGLFGSGSPSGLYGSSGGANGGIYSIDGANGGLYGGGDGTSGFYGGQGFGSSGAASSLVAALNGGSSGSSFGDLYASGASSSSVYNPSPSDSGRGYGAGGSVKGVYGGPGSSGSGSALYMSNSERNTDSYGQKSAQESVNSFSADSGRINPSESQYSMSYQQPQGKSFSGSSGFQPVAFSSEDGGYKGSSFSEKSS